MPNSEPLSIPRTSLWLAPLIALSAIAVLAIVGARFQTAKEEKALDATRQAIRQLHAENLQRISTSLLKVHDVGAATDTLSALKQVVPSLLDTFFVRTGSNAVTRVYPSVADLVGMTLPDGTGNLLNETRLLALAETLELSHNKTIAFIVGEPPSRANPTAKERLAVVWKLPQTQTNLYGHYSYGVASFTLDGFLDGVRGPAIDRLTSTPFDGSYPVILDVGGIAKASYFSTRLRPTGGLSIWLAVGVLITALVFSTFTHLTVRVRHRRLQEQVNKLEIQQSRQARLAALGELSSRISHELNQPLFAIEAYAATLVRHRGIDEEHQLHTLEKIRQESARAARATRAILDLSKNQSENLSDDQNTAQQILKDLTPLLLIEAQKQGVKLTLKSEQQESGTVPRVPVELFIMSTVTNAIEALAGSNTKSPEIIIETVAQGDQLLCIRVRNNGPLIDSEVASRVFDDFFTTKAQGSGLGLSTARTVARRHGGNIQLLFDSPGGQTTFEMTMPITAQLARAA